MREKLEENGDDDEAFQRRAPKDGQKREKPRRQNEDGKTRRGEPVSCDRCREGRESEN